MTDDGRLWTERRHHRRGPNLRAVGKALEAMRTLGQLEAVDEAIVVGTRTAAGLLDAALHDPDESRYTVRQVAAEYREWLALLRTLGGSDDALDALIAELSAPGRRDTPHA